MKNKTQSNSESDFFNEEKKIMRLSAIGMVADGDISYVEKVCITEIVLRDYLDGRINDLNNFVPDNFDKNKIQVEKQQDNNVVKIIYSDWYINICLSDNSIYERLGNDKELSENEIILCYVKARYYVETIAERLKQTTAQQGLFINIDTLSLEDVLLELRDCILVIRADKLIAETERAAFISNASIMDIKNPNKLWSEWVGESTDQLLNENVLSSALAFVEYSKDLHADTVDTVVQSIINYGIAGPLKSGLRNAIDYKLQNSIKDREKKNRIYYTLALIVFIITSFLIYNECTISVEKKIIQEEYAEFSHEVNPIINYLIKEGFISDTAIVDIGTINVEELDTSKKKEYYQKGVAKFLFKDGNDKFFNNFIYIPFIILLLYLIYTTIKFLFNKIIKLRLLKLKKWYYKFVDNCVKVGAVVLGIILLLKFYGNSYSYISMIYNSLLVLMMMISIEVMIFMREKYSKRMQEHNSSGVIIVLVAFAIIADFCIGFIEIPYDCITIELLSNKIASALLLGCISFFVGKFLETNSMQKQIEIDNMHKMIRNTNNYLSEKSNN